MGKLHKLRKAIEKNPQEWYWIDDKRFAYPMGARVYKWKGQWYCKPHHWEHSYKSFIKKVVGIL